MTGYLYKKSRTTTLKMDFEVSFDQAVPSMVLGACPIMKSLALAILTMKLGSFQPKAMPTPPWDPIGTNCMSLVIFL